MWKRNLLFVLLCGAGLLALAANVPRPSRLTEMDRQAEAGARGSRFQQTLARLNAAVRKSWAEKHLAPAPPADDLLVARRLALGLLGTIPSLEEVRGIQAAKSGDRLDRWTDRLLTDRRYHDYFAERLARAYVGVEGGPFILYRRRRLVGWLSEQLRDNRPYDQVVRELIAANGFATSRPATNFLAVTLKPEEQNLHVDERRLAAKVSRAFLGMRIDCAECHDHPFERWKQSDFEGLAAFFAGTHQRFSVAGMSDEADQPLKVDDRVTGTPRNVLPQVPFSPELLPESGSARQRLAAWVTDPGNRHFSQAMTNRVWALLFGRGLVEPVDDIQPEKGVSEPLVILAEDFAASGFDLRRLVRLIAASEAFRLDSRADPAVSSHEITPEHETAWAVFPLTRLRSEQVASAIAQAASLETLDGDTPLLLRVQKATDQNRFTERFGDAGENEMAEADGTIPQRLLVLNGDLVRKRTAGNPLFNAAGQIALFAADDREAIEVAYLAVLSRCPSSAETQHFLERLTTADRRERSRRIEDLYAALINSVEFSWNH